MNCEQSTGTWLFQSLRAQMSHASGEETSIPQGPQRQGGISKKITTKKEERNPCVPSDAALASCCSFGEVMGRGN